MSYAKVVGGGLNMRQDTSTDAARLTLIPNGSRIAILEKGTVWAKAVYNEYTGYVMTKYLQFEDEESSESKETDMVTIVLSRQTAKVIYEALKISLE